MNIAIETIGLTCRFGKFTAVDKLSLRIPSGSIYGFLGPNGSGKSTTIRMLCGILTPTAGTGTILGLDIVAQSEAIKRQIGYMSQKFSLYHDLSAKENLEFYAGLYNFSGAQKKHRIQAAMELTNLTVDQNILAKNLSGGIKQRLALACAILHEPKIIFLDEPTGGVDPKSRRMFWQIIYRLAEAGATILVTTHFMDEAEHCDAIGFIYNGCLVADGSPDALKKSIPGILVAIDSHDSLQALADLRASAIPIHHAYIYGKKLHVWLPDSSLPQLTAYCYVKIEPSMEDVFAHNVNLKLKEGMPT